MQIGFIPGKETIDVIFIIRLMMERYETAGKKLFTIFVNLKEALDRIPREVIWWALKKGYLSKFERKIKAIMKM